MSLDIYLKSEVPVEKSIGTGIFIRDKGETRELDYSEACLMYPDSDIEGPEGYYETDELFHANTTHNLNKMAEAVGIYEHLWRPEEINISIARELIKPLSEGLAKLLSSPEEYEQYNPENGWGSYEQLCDFVYKYIQACIKYPNAKIEVDR